MMALDPAAHCEHKRQYGNQAKQADTDMRRAPAPKRNEVLNDRRPYRSGEVIACCGKRDCDAAPAQKPMRDVGHQWSKAGGAADSDKAMGEGDEPQARRPAGREIPGRECQNAEAQGNGDSVAIGETTHEDAAARETYHHHREWKRRVGSRDAKFGLDGRQCDHDRPHADARERADCEGDDKTQPGVRRFDIAGLGTRLRAYWMTRHFKPFVTSATAVIQIDSYVVMRTQE